MASTAAARSQHAALRDSPLTRGPTNSPALGRQEKPDLKAMLNREIFTVQLRAQLKLCFATTLPRWPVVSYRADSKMEREERGGLTAIPWDHSPRRQRSFQKTPPAAHIHQAPLAGQAAKGSQA